jgi:RimJ/RimL family protein N-acetyltransferase
MGMAPTLRTNRLVLREFRDDDLGSLAAIHADPEVMRYTREGKPMTRAGTWKKLALYLGHWQLLGYGKWAVVEQSSGQLIGRVGLSNPEGGPGPELGWLIARERWNRGYATEAAATVLRYAFETIGLDHVISIIQERNLASIRVAEKLGEVLEHIDVVEDNKLLTYGIARTEWELRASRQDAVPLPAGRELPSEPA